MSPRPSAVRPSGEAALHSWPARQEPAVLHLESNQAGIDEFSSEQRHDEWTSSPWRWGDLPLLRIVSGIAAVEALALVALLVYFSGVLSPATGRLAVESQPAGAEVRVDGTVAGTTPLVVETTEGRHSVEVRRGEITRSMDVEVGRGETTRSRLDFVSMPLTPAAAPAEFRITTDPAGAAVSVDGVARGAAPLTIDDLLPGTHVVSVRGAGGTVRRSVEVGPGRSRTLHLMLPPPASGPGWIEIPSSLPLQVYENGRLVGASSAGRLLLAAGSHTLDFLNEEYGVRVREQVVVQSDSSTEVTPTLPRGLISINAEPWAEVWIDGERVGETPLGNLSWGVGQHDIVLRHPEFGERRARLRVTAGAIARLNVNLRQQVDEP